MKNLRRISIFIIGTVFFISGLLKMMDPVGTSLIVDEYLKFLHLGWLRQQSGILGTAISLFETLTGAALLTGIWRKIVSFVTLGLLGFFTVITVLLCIYNPPMDCGCFGEAIHLTHFQSLIKNLILLGLWAVAFLPLVSELPGRMKYVRFGIAALSAVGFMLYFQFHLPAKDFTPFKPGAELLGLNSDYSSGNPVLSFSNEDGEYADSLALGDKVLVFSIYDPDKLNQRNSDRIEETFNACTEVGINPLALISGTPDKYPGFYYSDRRTLMTLNRANGGATLICDGHITAKWDPAHFPNAEELERLASMDSIQAMISENSGKNLKLQAFLLYVFTVMLLLKLPQPKRSLK